VKAEERVKRKLSSRASGGARTEKGPVWPVCGDMIYVNGKENKHPFIDDKESQPKP
jgi:hypothetical protein